MDKVYKFEGLMAPVFTPFISNEYTLNTEAIPEYGNYLVSSGIRGVLVNGTTGEGMSLSVEERQRLAEAWKNFSLTSDLNVMVQVGGAPFPDVIKMAAHADLCGVDSILCLPDLFNKPSNVKELLEYLRRVSDAAPHTPLLYYHLPAYTGVNINITELLSEAYNSKSIPRFAGVKFTHINLEDGASSVRVGCKDTDGPGSYSMFLGSDETLLGAFALGFNSAIGTTFNIFPNLGKAILAAATSDNYIEGNKLQWQLTKAIRAITKHGRWVPAMKAAMNLLTPINVGPPRFPITPLTNVQEVQMREEIEALGVMRFNKIV